MTQQNKTGAFHQGIRPDRAYAQVMVQIVLPRTLEEVEELIRNSGIGVIGRKQLPSDWMLFKLNVKDMRSLVLKLTESGFSAIRGINALPFDNNE